MDGNDAGYASSRAAADECAGFMFEDPLCLKVIPQFLGVHVVRTFVNIHELRQSTGLRDCLGGSNKGIGHGDHTIAVTDPRSDDGEPQGISAAVHTDTVLNSAKACEDLLEFSHHG